MSRAFAAGVVGGVLAGLADAFLAVARTRGGLADMAMAAFLLSLSLWGAAGGIAAIVISVIIPGLQPEKAGPKAPLFASLVKEFLYFVSTVLVVSTLAFTIGRTVMLLTGDLGIRGIAVGFLTTGLAVLIMEIRLWRLAPPRRMLFLRIGGAAALCFVVLILATAGGKARTERFNIRRHDASVLRPAPAPGAPNILLVALDTVRGDRLSLGAGGRETTPFLRRLAEESTVYERAISPSPWTMPAHASIFTGQYPSVHQATFEHRYLSPELPTLAEILRESGYATAGFSSNPNVSSLYNFQQGFDDFYELFWMAGLWVNQGLDPIDNLFALKALRPFLGSPRIKRSDRAAEATQGFVSQWLDSRSQREKKMPFFIFINYLPAHLPYNPPATFRKRFLTEPPSPIIRTMMTDACYPEVWRLIASPELMKPADYAQLAALYDGELAFLDSCLERLIALFQDRGLLEDTIVIFVGDHGDNLGEHGGLLNHSFSVHQTLLHVPLIVRYPKAFEKNRRIPGVVSTGSIFPTILKMAGAESPKEWPSAFVPLPGVRNGMENGSGYAVSEYEVPLLELNALAEIPGTDVRPFNVSQRAIQTDAWKLVCRSDGTSWLYDLSADPAEDNPLDPRSSPEGARLEKTLAEWRAGLKIPRFSLAPPSAAPDKAARDLLRSLGYVR